jgi:uncharacterized protein YigA (DUF484 family)
LWNVAEEYKEAWFSTHTSDDIHSFARGLHTPFCGENKDFEAASWLDAPVTSLAMLPMRVKDEVVGLLVLGSPEKNRFTNNMATQFLSQIADAASAALSYLISVNQIMK